MSETPVTFNQLLIAMVRERPPLWDVRNPAYRDKTIKNKLWAEIGGIMQKNEWCSSEDDLRAKWKHLRDRYTKCVKDDNGSNQHVIGKKAPWPLLPYLDFLRDSVTHRSSSDCNAIKYVPSEFIQPHSLLMSLPHSEHDGTQSYEGEYHSHDGHEDKTAMHLVDSVFINSRSPAGHDSTQEENENSASACGAVGVGRRSPGPSRISIKRERDEDMGRSFINFLKDKRPETDATSEDLFFQSVAKESQQLSAIRRAKLKLKVQEYLVELLEEQECNK
ncbi:hypothetical protein R5R35_005083 [Gryllus longicercus]|uniref:MADF domain-containing protein n=1 Tax=Gryllus longicercus TaxID=2509291 RepID=A0AAN9VE32_9ORTH